MQSNLRPNSPLQSRIIIMLQDKSIRLKNSLHNQPKKVNSNRSWDHRIRVNHLKQTINKINFTIDQKTNNNNLRDGNQIVQLNGNPLIQNQTWNNLKTNPQRHKMKKMLKRRKPFLDSNLKSSHKQISVVIRRLTSLKIIVNLRIYQAQAQPEKKNSNLKLNQRKQPYSFQQLSNLKQEN